MFGKQYIDFQKCTPNLTQTLLSAHWPRFKDHPPTCRSGGNHDLFCLFSRFYIPGFNPRLGKVIFFFFCCFFFVFICSAKVVTTFVFDFNERMTRIQSSVDILVFTFFFDFIDFCVLRWVCVCMCVCVCVCVCVSVCVYVCACVRAQKL